MKICTKCKEEKSIDNFYYYKGKYQSNCKDCKKIMKAKYRKTNRYLEVRRKSDKLRYRIKYEEDIFYVIKKRIRARITNIFSTNYKWNKKNTSEEILGCSFEEISKHLESQFIEGMSWDNRSEWHIDHIIPLASATTDEELIKLCHYTNLQPLWAIDNLRKSNKII